MPCRHQRRRPGPTAPDEDARRVRCSCTCEQRAERDCCCRRARRGAANSLSAAKAYRVRRSPESPGVGQITVRRAEANLDRAILVRVESGWPAIVDPVMIKNLCGIKAHFDFRKLRTMIAINGSERMATMETPIKVGSKTCHQGQAMWPVSLRPTNSTCSKPKKPIPLEELEELELVGLI